MEFSDFYKHCDALFKDWVNTGNKAFEKSPYNKIKGQKFPDINGMPEPFIGNPEKCSAVIININPGGVMPGFNNRGGLLETCCEEFGYSRVMKRFPYVDTFGFNTKGGEFWKLRIEWIDRIVDKWIKPDIKDRLPFALEVCPWHSTGRPDFSEDILGEEELSREINNHVISIAAKAISNSLLPCGIVIGQAGYDALRKLGFKCIYEPISRTTPSIREFVLLEKDEVKFLCVLSPKGGSNKPPQKGFDSIVLGIIEHCLRA